MRLLSKNLITAFDSVQVILWRIEGSRGLLWIGCCQEAEVIPEWAFSISKLDQGQTYNL